MSEPKLDGDLPVEEGAQLEAQAQDDPHNAANPAAIKSKRKFSTEKEKALVRGMSHVLESRDGRVLLSWLLNEVCGLYAIAENAGFCTEALHYKEGGRVVGLELHKLALRANPKQYMEMTIEPYHNG